ncbi:hypothetical protein WMF31_38125 [Sorangium sp. So ce1036]|uniref:hypothetical protein n=1 Tax=Sorangium sp. So ce1036 TaxID=3133328 RepID=UPI003F0603FF
MNDKSEKVMRLERYAEVLAHVVHFRGADLYEVLARLGVAPEDWARADAEHTAELALSAQRNQGIQALRFSSVFARTRRSLEARRPSLESLGPPQRPAAGNAAPAHLAPQAALPASPQGPAFALPRSSPERADVSPWAAHASARPETVRAGIPQGTADIAELVPRPALPFQASQAQSAGQSAPEGRRLPRFDPQTGRPLGVPLRVDAPKTPSGEES